MKNQFAFLLHYPNLGSALEVLEQQRPLLQKAAKLLSRGSHDRLKETLLDLPPYRWFQFDEILSASGKKVAGIAIICPFLPEQLVTFGEDRILKKVFQGGRLAKRCGVKLIGLAGFCSIVGDEGLKLAKTFSMPVTSGNTYTAALAIQGIRRAAHLMGLKLETATMAVIGATGDIGSVCSRVFSKEVSELNLAARNEKRLEDFAQLLRNGHACINVKKYIGEAIHNADIILAATSSITTLIEAKDVKSGAIICDVAIPHNVATSIIRERPDVLAFEGGLAQLPKPLKLSDQRWLKWISPDGRTIFGCLAETVLLSLESRWESFSISRGNITPERVNEISKLASRHGFSIADFRYDGSVFTERDIQRIRQYAKSRITSNHVEATRN